MTQAADPARSVDPQVFLTEALRATSTKRIRDLVAQLPVVDAGAWKFDANNPASGWEEGKFHWYPVGADRANAGRIKLAGRPENPLAERTINAMESLLEQERQLELLDHPNVPAPASPRDAAKRYFDLPPLYEIPRMAEDAIRGQKTRDYVRALARRIKVRLVRTPKPVEYAVMVEDDGIGQAPERMHQTLLALGSSEKPDKPYLIGVFGQGGSSAYSASESSWLVSRRDARLRKPGDDGLGWTVVRHIFPKGRRDDYWAYLAAHPDGRVPAFSAEAAEAIGFDRGTTIAHLKYNFGKMEAPRMLYPALNHLIFAPVLPYEIYTRPAPGRPDPMYGNAYRLAQAKAKSLDKVFEPQPVEREG